MSDLRKISKEKRMRLRVMSSRCKRAMYSTHSKEVLYTRHEPEDATPVTLTIPNDLEDYSVAEVVIDNVIGFEKSCFFIRWESFRTVNFCRCENCYTTLTEVEQQFHQYLMHKGYELERVYLNNVETSTFLIINSRAPLALKTTPTDDTTTVVGDEIES